MTNSSPWKITMLLIGEPSISMGHLYHGYVSHNQRVTYPSPPKKTCCLQGSHVEKMVMVPEGPRDMLGRERYAENHCSGESQQDLAEPGSALWATSCRRWLGSQWFRTWELGFSVRILLEILGILRLHGKLTNACCIAWFACVPAQQIPQHIQHIQTAPGRSHAFVKTCAWMLWFFCAIGSTEVAV